MSKSKLAETIREGFRISIIGAPNAGKSTLMNTLAQRRVAIVSDIPGTTRDLIQTNLTLMGFNVVLTDTAGLRESEDTIEKEGIKLAKEEASKSDGVILVVDASELETKGNSLHLDN